MANANATQLQQLYVAYFGRSADPSGLDYWVSAGTSTKAFAASMHAQSEFQSANKDKTVEQQINQIYNNLFGRNADPNGLLYWTNQVKTEAVELASIANDFIFTANNDAESAADLAVLNNKTAAAEAYTAQIRLSTDAIVSYAPTSTSPYVSGDAFTEAKSFLSGIKTTAHTTEALSASVTALSAEVVAAVPTTYTLTADSPSITEADSGAKDLTFTISLDAVAEKEVTVNYETLTTGTASAGDDFTTKAGTVIFAAGQQTATISVSTLGDTSVEADETVSIKFTGSDLVDSVTASGTISNNDSETVVSDFTLTTGVDQPSATYSTFDGSLTSGGTQTLGSLDKISGTTGSSDVLNATIKTSVTPASITGIETVNIVVGGTDAATLGLVNATGVTTVNAGGAAGALTVSGIDTTTAITITDTAVAHTFTFNDVTGSSDSITASFAQVTGNTTSITLANIETITATSAGGSASNAFDLNADTLTTLTLDGSGDLTLASLATGTTKVKTINASGMTGALDVTTGALSLGTSQLTITGGSGNDSIDSSAHVGTDVSIDGGAGNDTVTHSLATTDTIDGGTGTDNLITTAVITSAGNVSGFETFTLDTTGGSLNQDFDNLSGNTFTKLVADGDGTNTDDATFTDIPASITDLELSASASGDVLTDRKTDTTSDSLTVTTKGDTTTILTSDEEETLAFVSDTAASTISTLNALDVTKITVTGSADLTISTVAKNVGLATIDASGSTGAVSIGDTANASTTAMTVTAGSGGLTLGGSSKADTVTGGAGIDDVDGDAGADSLIGAGGNDILDGGTGNDVLSGGAGNDALTSGAGDDNIDGGAGNDTITMGGSYSTDDTLVGGEGTDAVSMTITGAATTTFTAASISGIEEFTLTGSTGANVYDFKNLTGVEEVTIANGHNSNQTVQGLNTGVTVNILEPNAIATIDTADAASVSIDVEVNKTEGSVAVTDTASVTVTGKIATGDIVALALDAVDTTSLVLATTSTNDLDTGHITNTDKVTSITATTAADGGTIAVNAIVDGSSITSLTLTGVGGDITTGTLFATDDAANLATINATSTKGAIVTFGAISADTTLDSVTDNAMTITSSASGVDGSNIDGSVVFGKVDNQYGTITLNHSGDGVKGTTTGALTAVDVTVTSTGGDVTIGNVDASEDFTLTVTGTSTATVTDMDADTFASIDASASSGKLTVSANSSDGNVTILGGSAGDAITSTTAAASGKVHSISGGAGADTITGGAGNETILGGDGNDSIVGAAGNDSLTGGAGNDTFNFGTAGDLGNGDTVDGGAGTDTVLINSILDLDSSSTATTSTTLTNVETVDIQATATGKAFDASNWTSLTTLIVGAATNTHTMTVNNIVDGVTVQIDDSNLDDSTFDVATGADITVDLEVTTATGLTITDAVNVTVTSSDGAGDATALALDATDTKTLTLTGSSDAVALDVGNVTNTDEITTLTATSSKASATVLMGTMVDADGLTALNVTAENANITLGAIGTAATANNAELLANITTAVTGTSVVLTTGAIIADTTVDSTTDLAMTLDITTNAGAQSSIGAIDNTYGSITGTFNSHSSNDTDIGNLTAVAMTLNVDGEGDTDFQDLIASGAVAVTATGSGNVTIDDANIDGTSASLTVDASAMSGTIHVKGANTSVATTQTGGSGNDTLKGGSVADSLTGGAGDDSLTTNAGDDTVSGGAGADTIVAGTGDNVVTGGLGNDTITSGAGFDNIDAGAGDDKIVLAANMSLSDTVAGGAGNDTITATLSSGSASQRVGTLSGVENFTLDFAQATGSFDSTNATTAAYTVTNAADNYHIDIDNLATGSTVKITAEGDSVDLDYADDATAAVTLYASGGVSMDDTFAITDAQTVNLTVNGGGEFLLGTTMTFDATDTDYVTITVDDASSDLHVDGAFAADNAQTFSLVSTDGGIIDFDSTGLGTADLLTSFTVSNTGGTNAADVTFGSFIVGNDAAAAKLTTIDLDASHGGDITAGAFDAAGATLTSITMDATTTGSVIDIGGAIIADSITNITTTAVSGASVDFSGVLTVSTVGTIKHTGAGNFTMDAANAFTTVERIDMTGATGTNVINLSGGTNAATVNLGTGADTVTVTGGVADDINLSTSASVDKIEYSDGVATPVATISNFAFGTGVDIAQVSLAGFETAGSVITGTMNIVSGNDDDLAAGTQTIQEITAATTLAANDDVLVFVGVTFANVADAEASIIAAGDQALTTGATLEHDDAILMFYTDGTDGYLAAIITTDAIAATAALAAEEIDVKNLLKFEGITSIASGDITDGDIIISA